MSGGRLTSLPRGDLAAMIYGTIAERVETIFGDSIAAIEQNDSSVLVKLQTGASREFDLVIGAGGLHSPVRRLVFGPDAMFEHDLGYRVAAFQAHGYRPRDELVYVTYSTPRRMVGRFAMRDDRTMFVFVFTADQIRGPDPSGPEETEAVLCNVFGDAGWECPQILEALKSSNDLYCDRVSQISMPGWSDGRVMLIGDAAAAVSLLAGEGTGLAMLQAYVLASELNRAGTDYRQAFRRHERLLGAFINRKQRSARRLAAAMAPTTWPGVWVRNQLSRLLSLPFMGDWIIQQQLRDDLDLPAVRRSAVPRDRL